MKNATRPIDVITFGESMGLLYPEGTRGIGQGGSMAQSFGGAESNLAIGLSRLGAAADGSVNSVTIRSEPVF